MTEQDLQRIEARATWAQRHSDGLSPILTEVAVLIAEVRRLEALVRQAEWAGYDGLAGDGSCPWCEGAKPTHSQDCEAFL